MANDRAKTDKRFALAMDWIQSVKEPILDIFYRLDAFDLKSNNTEVTEADRNTEKDFRAMVDSNFCDDGIIGEEFSEDNRKGDYTWTIDPIDGTRAFTRGVPFFGTMVGLYHGDKILFGIIAYHALGEITYAKSGEGCFWKAPDQDDFQRIRVSDTEQLSAAVLSHSGEEYFAEQNQLPNLDKLKSRVHFTRTWGDCYGYNLLARGKIDIMCDPILHQWDLVPIKIIAEEAGGLFLNLDGSPSSIHSTSSLCANPVLMKELLAD